MHCPDYRREFSSWYHMEKETGVAFPVSRRIGLARSSSQRAAWGSRGARDTLSKGCLQWDNTWAPKRNKGLVCRTECRPKAMPLAFLGSYSSPFLGSYSSPESC